jgi:hypothetical protein
MRVITFDVKKWEEMKTTSNTSLERIMHEVEDICFQISFLWPRITELPAVKNEKIAALEKSRELETLLGTLYEKTVFLPHPVRPSRRYPLKLLLWATIVSCKLGVRSL